MTVQTVSDRYHTVTPYLIVEGVAALLAFLTQAFDAAETLRLHRPDGSIMHAEVDLGDSVVMLGEPTEEFGSMPASIYLQVEDCDQVYQRAIQAGGISVMKPMDMYHAGQRYGGVKDPSGNSWWVGTRIEDVSPEEQARRIAESEKRR